jgi:hypothetical protein
MPSKIRRGAFRGHEQEESATAVSLNERSFEVGAPVGEQSPGSPGSEWEAWRLGRSSTQVRIQGVRWPEWVLSRIGARVKGDDNLAGSRGGPVTFVAWFVTLFGWLICGALVVGIARLAQPFGDVPGSPVAAALSGAFLGGMFVLMVADLRGLSICGAVVGAIVGVDSAQRESGTIPGAVVARGLGWLWRWVIRVEPVLVGALAGVTVSIGVDSWLVGTLVGFTSMLAVWWQERDEIRRPRNENSSAARGD